MLVRNDYGITISLIPKLDTVFVSADRKCMNIKIIYQATIKITLKLLCFNLTSF